jgi:AraC family transcriptional regulator, transcriptional activator of pobA
MFDKPIVPIFDAATFRQRHFESSVEWTSLFLPNFDQFMIHRIESHKDLIRFPLPPHRKSIYDFIFITQGHTIRSKDLDQYELGSGTFFFLPAYQITTNGLVTDDAQGFYCHFDAHLLTGGYEQRVQPDSFPFLQIESNPVLRLDDSMRQRSSFLLERLLDEYQSDRPDRLPLIRLYLLTLLTELKRVASATADLTVTTAASRLTQRFKMALLQHIYERQQVSQYADLLATSPNHLNKCVRQTLGRTAHSLIEDMLLLETKILLRQTTLSIAQIADHLNQNDPSDFGRFFKRNTGFTLTQYRAMD